MIAHFALRALAFIGCLVVAALLWNGIEYLPDRLSGQRPSGPTVKVEGGRAYVGEVPLASKAEVDDLRHRFERHTHGGRGVGSASSAVGSAAE